MALISFTSFDTEVCCDFFQITNSAGTSVFYGSGSTIPSSILVKTPTTLTFLSDVSVTAGGVVLSIVAVPGSLSSSPSQSPSPFLILRASQTATIQMSRTKTARTTAQPSQSETATAEPSQSETELSSETQSETAQPSSSQTAQPSQTQTSPTIRPSVTSWASQTSWASVTAWTSQTSWASVTAGASVTAWASPSQTSWASPSQTTQASPSQTTQASQTPIFTMPSLKNISTSALISLFHSMSTINPLELKGLLNTLTSAALLKGNGSFSIQTDAFTLQSKTLSAYEPLILPSLSLPPLGLPQGSFASMIQWTKNPYDDSSNPVVSINALTPDASVIPINSLSTPFTSKWSLDTTVYTFLCETDTILLRQANSFILAPNVTKLTPKLWSVPCGTTRMNVTCPTLSYTCPSVTDCVYWNTSLSSWMSDGCFSEVNGTNILCHCTHMTDFSMRLRQVSNENEKLFANAKNVYSAEGLKTYAQWYSIFSSLGLFSILLIIYATYLDFPIRKLYIDLILKDSQIKQILEITPYTPVYRYNGYSSHKFYKRLDTPVKKHAYKFNPCTRMCIQHTYIQTLLKFDPRLARPFRILFLLLIQCHSLFVTAALYGFTYGTGELSISDTILLAVITSSITIPCVRISLYMLNYVGLKEFQYRFPILYAEYMKRVDFEKNAEPLYASASSAGDGNADAAANADANAAANALDEDSLFLSYIEWVISLCKSNILDDAEKAPINRQEIMKTLASIIRKEYPKFQTYSPAWDILPCHTKEGWFFLLTSFGWIGWCLQYLLLFAAAHSTSVGNTILTSYATSELSTIFVTQPIVILVTTAFFIFIHKYKDSLPWPLSRLGSVSTKHNIPSLYYFSNPLNHTTYNILSSEFGYSIFQDIPAHAAGVDPLSTAPIKSILTTINKEEGEQAVDTRVKDLYFSMVQYYKKHSTRDSMLV